MTGEQLLIKTIKQCNAFEARVIELEVQVDEANIEASNLAMFLFNKFYKGHSIGFELCDTPAGIISQIDNMVAGIIKNK